MFVGIDNISLLLFPSLMTFFPTLNENDLEGGGGDDVGDPDPDPDSDLTDKITPVSF